jgi:SpoIID/LytB domain protein
LRRLVLTLSLALVLVPAAHGQRFVIFGHGWGHGVGMSQYGADGFAAHGWSYRRILAHYYPGTRLERQKHSVQVRVLLLESASRIVLSAKSSFRFVDARGKSHHVKKGRFVLSSGHIRWHLPLRFEAGVAPLRLDGKGYRGDLVVRRGLTVVNELPLERYLRGVVPWEMPYYWRPAALAAQTIAARTYALHQLHSNTNFDVYADARDQMYGGIAAERGSTNRIIGLTHGLVVTWHGLPALTYYDSTSGGRTASSADAFQLDLPYLASVSDPYDSLSPHHSWRYRYTSHVLAEKLGVPGVKKVAQAENHSGRVAYVAVHWRGGVRIMTGKTVQERLDLPSTWFRISATKR